jgi:hypothetical protein
MYLDVLSVVWLLGFVTLSVMSCIVCWQGVDHHFRTPFVLFYGAYGITTVVGATLLGLFKAPLIESLDYGLDITVLSDFSSMTYWSILYAPMILVPLCTLCCSKLFRQRQPVFEANYPKSGDGQANAGQVNIVAFAVVYAAFAIYPLLSLFQAGCLDIDTFLAFQGDFHGHIVMRTELFDSHSSSFFGIIYTLLPALSFCALFQWLHRHTVAWRCMTVLCCAFTCVLNLGTLQKSKALFFLLMLTFGMVELKMVRWKTFVTVALTCFLLFTAMQIWILTAENWSSTDTISLLVFRMSTCYPYYINIYPAWEPFIGVDLGLNAVGLAEVPKDNLVVFKIMYPDLVYAQGAAAAPAHVRAYAQGGMTLALVTTAVIALFVTVAAILRKNLRSPLCFAFYMQMLIALYNLANTSLVETMTSGYGLIWATIGLCSVWLVSWFLNPTKPHNDLQPREQVPEQPRTF